MSEPELPSEVVDAVKSQIKSHLCGLRMARNRLERHHQTAIEEEANIQQEKEAVRVLIVWMRAVDPGWVETLSRDEEWAP